MSRLLICCVLLMCCLTAAERSLRGTAGHGAEAGAAGAARKLDVNWMVDSEEWDDDYDDSIDDSFPYDYSDSHYSEEDQYYYGDYYDDESLWAPTPSAQQAAPAPQDPLEVLRQQVAAVLAWMDTLRQAFSSYPQALRPDSQ